MKKFIKSILSISLLVLVVFGFTACKTPLSSTTIVDDKSIVDGTSTNGGTTAIYGDYLYFINGQKTNDGTSSRGTTQGAICRVKYDLEAGKVAEDAKVEIVVSDLVGYEDGSINIFGDFLYYTTPNNNKNYQGTTLYSKTDFKRYDLVNKNSYTLYTTHLNNSSEYVDYAYYFVDDSLYLLVYESVSKTLTSLKIGNSTELVYRINDVESCVFSNNNGKRVDENVVDANNFVFYTTKPSIAVDGYEDGSKVYKASPSKKGSSVWMGNKSADDLFTFKFVSLLSIQNGKLIYSAEWITGDTFIYAQSIGESSKLEFNDSDKISGNAYEDEKDLILFDELENGSVSVIAYDSTSYQIVYVEKENGENVPHTIIVFGKETEIDFVGKVTVNEIEKNEDDEIIKDDEVEYLLYTITESSKVTLYKVEVKRNGVIAISQNAKDVEVVIDDGDGMIAMNGMIMPETIKNNLFIIANDKDKNAYMHYVDLSKTVDDDNKLTFIGKK